jgi:hypothetical protein
MVDANRRALAWSERTRLHQVVTVVDLLLIVGFGVVLFASTSQPLIWTCCAVVLAVVLVDCWLMWKRMGDLGRR